LGGAENHSHNHLPVENWTAVGAEFELACQSQWRENCVVGLDGEVVSEEEVEKVLSSLHGNSQVGELMKASGLSKNKVYQALHILEGRNLAHPEDPIPYGDLVTKKEETK